MEILNMSSGDEFIPQNLDSTDQQKRAIAAENVLNFFKEAFNVSDASLVWNANNLLTALSKANEDLFLVGASKKRLDSAKFKLTYCI